MISLGYFITVKPLKYKPQKSGIPENLNMYHNKLNKVFKIHNKKVKTYSIVKM